MVDPSLTFRRKPEHDTEDLACTFLEEEVGRFDWINNWKTIKSSGAALNRVREWLSLVNIQHDPQAIVEYLDKLATTRTGRWH